MIEHLQKEGYKNISILEGSWIGENTGRAFKACGYGTLSKKYGVPLLDLQKDSSFEFDAAGMKLKICSSLKEIDFLINIPVLKGHCQTKMTCALKNLKGCIPDSEKRRFHTMGLHKPIAHLNLAVKSSLVIIDGLMGDLNFEEGGNPVEMNRIIMGIDPVLLDTYAAELMGLSPDEVPYIRIAEEIGVGSSDLGKAHIHHLNEDRTVRRSAKSGRAEVLARYVKSEDACSACYGSLLHALERLDEKGLLDPSLPSLCIGQGYRGKTGKGVGIGSCTSGLGRSLKGCPPSAGEILRFLQGENWE